MEMLPWTTALVNPGNAKGYKRRGQTSDRIPEQYKTADQYIWTTRLHQRVLFYMSIQQRLWHPQLHKCILPFIYMVHWIGLFVLTYHPRQMGWKSLLWELQKCCAMNAKPWFALLNQILLKAHIWIPKTMVKHWPPKLNVKPWVYKPQLVNHGKVLHLQLTKPWFKADSPLFHLTELQLSLWHLMVMQAIVG